MRPTETTYPVCFLIQPSVQPVMIKKMATVMDLSS